MGGAGNDILLGGDGADTMEGGTGNDLLDGGAGADSQTGGEGFDTFIAGNGDTITDFNTATGQDFADGNQANNDFVDLSGHYNAANLATINAARRAAGLKEYATALGWMRGDQADGVLNDISTANGFAENFSMTIRSGAGATAPKDLTFDNTNVVCFSGETLIETAEGPVRADALKVGDSVRTRDAGLQPVRWIGRRHLDTAMLAANPNLRPIRIAAGSLGANTPSSDLVVSPQHRVLIRSKIAARMFGTTEVLVAAKQLLLLDGIDIAEDLIDVTYVHFLFDAHQIVYSNGAETESLHTGDEALKSVGAAARVEILALFPELQAGPARPLVAGRQARKLADRHQSNRRPLVM